MPKPVPDDGEDRTAQDGDPGASSTDRSFISVPDRLPAWAGILVSAAAIGIAFLHVAFPDLRIDTTTVALLGLAAFPWFVPIIKSLKLPGGVEIVLRDLQETVTDVQARVEEGAEKVENLARTIERLTFTGAALRPDVEQDIQSRVESLADALSRAGLPIPSGAPRVVVHEPGIYASFVPGEGSRGDEIHIGSDVSDPLVAARPYLFHVLNSVDPDAPWEPRRLVVERALTFYYYADHAWGELVFGDELRDAAPTETADDPLAQWPISAAWARMLWTLRPLLGPEGTARVLAEAWLRSAGSIDDFYVTYATNVVAAVKTSSGLDQQEAARAVFTENGISVTE